MAIGVIKSAKGEENSKSEEAAIGENGEASGIATARQWQ
jgi:hypothetical protein